MQRSLLLMLFSALLAISAWAQDAEEPATDANEATIAENAEPAPDAAAEPAAETEAVLDDEYYQDVDDKDFRPSEDIPADQSIPFPSDI
jgi:hypothetical protein